MSKCIESLINQDIVSDFFEIIIVNDGSTDSTVDIAELHAKENKNIIVITQSNKGIGAARNAGIRTAKGKYLMFVDSDDYLEKNVLSLLTDKIESNKLDVLRFNYLTVDENFVDLPKKKNSTYSVNWEEEILNGEDFLTDKLGWGCYAWLYILNTYFIKHNDLYFNEQIIFEDVEWLVRVLMKSHRVMPFNKHVYYYVHRKGSVTQSLIPENKKRIISDKIYIVNFLKTQSHTTEVNKVRLWCEGMISLIFMGILSYVENELPARKPEIIHMLNHQGFLPLKSYRFTGKQMRDLIIININPRIYCYLKRRR